MENQSTQQDVSSLNRNILNIDLQDLQIETMEQRIELTLATLFGGDLWDGFDDPDEPCSQFSCNMYF